MPGRLQNFLRVQAEGKALGTHPAFMDPGTPVGVTDLNIINRAGRSGKPAISQREAMRHLEAYGGNQAIDWVMDCVRFTADTVASAEYHFQKQAPPNSLITDAVRVAPPEMLGRLLDQPNPYMDYTEMMELLVIDYLMVGNAYWFKWQTNSAQQPLALYRLAPGHMKVVPGKWGIEGYEYSVPGMDKMLMGLDEVIHFKLANPHNPYYGLGLIQGAGRTADLELALTDSAASYMENHAMPSMTVTTDRRVPRDVFKKLRAQLRARTQGPRNAGELLVLEAGLKLDSVAPNAQQAGYGELSKISRDRLFAWFRMSPKLIGIMDEKGGADKIADAQRIFDDKTARPLMNKFQRKITHELTQAWGVDYHIDYEYQMPPEDLAKLGAAFGLLPGVIVDEVRRFAKLPPHPDKTIGEMTLNLPGADAGTGQPGDPTRQGFPDRNLPTEPGRPPNPENTRAFPKAGEPMPAGAEAKAMLDSLGAKLEVWQHADDPNVSEAPARDEP